MSFILRRLVFYLVAAWVALTINFFIPRAMPGNAVQSIMSKFPNLQPSAYHALEVNADLATLAGASTTAAQTQALVPIEQFVAANLPIIPTTTASEWFEYNSQNYTGWPTQDNPYETGQPSGTNNGPGSGTDEVVILHLSPWT